ncbi:hypothetical protein SAMN05660686_01380 [Thalassobaculum litoreum DSM 18839]|uniref:Uncharacterized protein n=2 Tax=Thalassobaculum TaxID=526215 RepID=A0A8G2EVU0_9PROT|nr:hypothetical protein SAMN05660686_01380 [Thalassobaculum litoreum DSM 18839]
MAAHPRLSANMFDASLRAVEHGLVSPLGGTVAVHNAVRCLSRFGDDFRRAMAEGGDLRRTAQSGASRLQRQIVVDVLPSLAQAFDDAARESWRNPGADTKEDAAVGPLDAAALLGALAAWQRASGSGTEASALIKRIGARMAAEATDRVDRFKALQSPEDSPDYRAAMVDLAAMEAMIRVAARLDDRQAMAEVGRLRDHYAKIALLSALTVIDRGGDAADMFVHFDIAAMLVSVEHVVAVISRTLDVVERERTHAHPHVETISEHVVRDFASGLLRLAPNYVRMLKNTVSKTGTAVPEFGFSILRVLLQITRLIRILHHHLPDGGLAEVANKIAADVAELRGKLLDTARNDQLLLARMHEALDALAAAPHIATPPGAGADRS